MAKRSGNGHGNGKDPVVTAIHELTTQVVGRLAALEAGQTAIEQVLRGHGRQLEGLHAGLADLRAEVHEGFADLGQKITSAAERDRHLEESMRDLGERVARLEARSST